MRRDSKELLINILLLSFIAHNFVSNTINRFDQVRGVAVCQFLANVFHMRVDEIQGKAIIDLISPDMFG
jgi:hypothetical protein